MVIFSSILPYHVILKLAIGNLAQYILLPWPNEEDRTWFFENPSTGSKVRAISVLKKFVSCWRTKDGWYGMVKNARNFWSRGGIFDISSAVGSIWPEEHNCLGQTAILVKLRDEIRSKWSFFMIFTLSHHFRVGNGQFGPVHSVPLVKWGRQDLIFWKSPFEFWFCVKKSWKFFKLANSGPIGRPPIFQNGPQNVASNTWVGNFFYKTDPPWIWILWS